MLIQSLTGTLRRMKEVRARRFFQVAAPMLERLTCGRKSARIGSRDFISNLSDYGLIN
jgi:hypothetical protein